MVYYDAWESVLFKAVYHVIGPALWKLAQQILKMCKKDAFCDDEPVFILEDIVLAQEAPPPNFVKFCRIGQMVCVGEGGWTAPQNMTKLSIIALIANL